MFEVMSNATDKLDRSFIVGCAGLVLFTLLCLVLRGLVHRPPPSVSGLHRPATPLAQTWRIHLPPSRRFVLEKLGQHNGRPVSSSSTHIDDANLPSDAMRTPTGFTVEDIQSLGRFPDYATLSGVRLPQAVGSNFDITNAHFRPFRPFRWPYHQTMAYQKLDPDWWVEVEHNYAKVLKQRQDIRRQHEDLVFYADPGSELACRELMEMLVQFLCRRYPQYFRLSDNQATFYNDLLGTQVDLSTRPPLEAIFENIPEDYALMLRNPEDGLYYLRAAAVCSSVGWDIGSHRGKQLRHIHEHDVPQYKSKLAFSMDRFFAKMPTNQPIQRCSWSLEDHTPLFSSPNEVASKGKEWQRSAFAGREADLMIEDTRLRCDYQTLRRLPLSGAIAFNFKAVFTPLTELRDEPKVPALLAKVLRDGSPDLIGYKVLPHVKDVALRACDVWAAEQVANGLMPADWEPCTPDESPFYPGWEAKWEKQQGFSSNEMSQSSRI